MFCDSPVPRSQDFGDEAVCVKKFQQSAGIMTLSTVLKIVGRRFVALLANVGVAKSLEIVFFRTCDVLTP